MPAMMGFRRCRGGQDQRCEKTKDEKDSLSHNLKHYRMLLWGQALSLQPALSRLFKAMRISRPLTHNRR
jgi:hypothetical protein